MAPDDEGDTVQPGRPFSLPPTSQLLKGTCIMLKKKYTKSGPVKVTFEVDHLPDADTVEVLGDFNQWQPETLQKFKNGKHKITKDLEPGNDYQFRYRVDGERWENDPDADRYQPNEYGEENSVVVC
jgi:1,4-alpha-glucan branching enzyme